MIQPGLVPTLPDTAPFTPEQRAYLNGFFAGLFSRGPAPGAGGPSTSASPAAAPMQPLTILFGSQTGTAERLAKRISRDAGQRGFAPTIYELSAYPMERLASERSILIITSTYGDGEPPDNAKSFWDHLSGPSAPALAQVRFSVCALGDSNYPRFCAFGKCLDEQLEKLGAQRARARVDCDVEFEAPFVDWLASALAALAPEPASGASTPAEQLLPSRRGNEVDPGSSPSSPPHVGDSSAEDAKPVYDRRNPYLASLVGNQRLNGEGSSKDTRHFDFDLAGSGLTYAPGDALGVVPTNCPELVTELIRALRCTGEESVPGGGAEVSLRQALSRCYDITRIQPSLLKAFAEQTNDDLLRRLTAPGVNGELTDFLRGRETIDLLLTFPEVRFAPTEFVGLLKKLQPRLYSISSSPKAHAGHVHLCVGVVRYESWGRPRQGVCSTYLADRVVPAQAVPVFFHSNPNFRPPAKGETPMIMIGPGTGVAPFRGFLHERRAIGATGRHWLFFGDQRAATDFLFREELEGLHRDGLLTRLDTAFSRDQTAKVYVQDRMLEQAVELFAWLESGAHFYVCGDASRMARDVDTALHRVIQTAGGRSEEQAAEYVKRLKAEKRYQRDVY